MNRIIIIILLKNLTICEKNIKKLHDLKYRLCKKIDERVSREVEKESLANIRGFFCKKK